MIRAQIFHRDHERKTEIKEDVKYGQNLIKQIGSEPDAIHPKKYLNVRKNHGRKPANEPNGPGTIYDSIFATKIHQSKDLSKKTAGTRLHALTQYMQDERNDKLNMFEDSHNFGGTLLENKTRRREDMIAMNKFNLQNTTAMDLKR